MDSLTLVLNDLDQAISYDAFKASNDFNLLKKINKIYFDIDNDSNNINWKQAENIAFDILNNKFKSLEVLVYLIQARSYLYGFDIFINDYNILFNFIKKFDQLNDLIAESKDNILEVFFKNQIKFILTYNIKELSDAFELKLCLADILRYFKMLADSKKSEELMASFNLALQQNLLDETSINNYFKQLEKSKCDTIVKNINNSVYELDNIYNLTLVHDALFRDLKFYLNTLAKYYNMSSNAIISNNNNDVDSNLLNQEIEASNSNIKSISRNDVYKSITDIGNYLMNTDPHSPAPILLQMIGSWQDKTFDEILISLQNSPNSLKSILKLLSVTANNNYTDITKNNAIDLNNLEKMGNKNF